MERWPDRMCFACGDSSLASLADFHGSPDGSAQRLLIDRTERVARFSNDCCCNLFRIEAPRAAVACLAFVADGETLRLKRLGGINDSSTVAGLGGLHAPVLAVAFLVDDRLSPLAQSRWSTERFDGAWLVDPTLHRPSRHPRPPDLGWTKRRARQPEVASSGPSMKASIELPCIEGGPSNLWRDLGRARMASAWHGIMRWEFHERHPSDERQASNAAFSGFGKF
ncbi:MAG: hypothetical protein M1823_005440 [Watsoniomyces obsoletus]|nr:MAG: hypothetical protein M1823_005440 [Watsoniomyces obsoletus]